MTEPLVAAINVARVYAGDAPVTALAGVSAHARPGEVLGILGPSGSGKSTLLHLLGLLERPTSGAVAFDGKDPWTLRPAERSRLRLTSLGFVFQSPHLVPELSVVDNVALPARAADWTADEARKRGRELLDHLGLPDKADRRPRELSGGEAQRVGLARALVNRPRLLLMDEPTAHLDDDVAARVLDDVRDYVKAGGCVVLATHDPRAVRVCTRRLKLARGRVTGTG